MQAAHIEGGFAVPVLDAQAVFRAVMQAMAEPGTVRPLRPEVSPPAPLSPSAAAVAQTLCDNDTSVWLDPALGASEAVAAWLGFHIGLNLTHAPADAHFALIAEPRALLALDDFAQGPQEYPDRSTTLILQVESLDAGAPLALEGPGIETVACLAPEPLPQNFAEQWRRNNARFPRGVDLILAAPRAVVCLPRTTRVRKQEG